MKGVMKGVMKGMGKGKVCCRVGGALWPYMKVISLKSSNRGGFDRIYVSTHSLFFQIKA